MSRGPRVAPAAPASCSSRAWRPRPGDAWRAVSGRRMGAAPARIAGLLELARAATAAETAGAGALDGVVGQPVAATSWSGRPPRGQGVAGGAASRRPSARRRRGAVRGGGAFRRPAARGGARVFLDGLRSRRSRRTRWAARSRPRPSGCSPPTDPRGWSGTSSWWRACRTGGWPDLRRRRRCSRRRRWPRPTPSRRLFAVQEAASGGPGRRARGRAPAVLRRGHPGPPPALVTAVSGGDEAELRPSRFLGELGRACRRGEPPPPRARAARAGRRAAQRRERPGQSAGAARRSGGGARALARRPAADTRPVVGPRRVDRARGAARRPRLR